jgi:hypothetical protein
LQQKEHDFHQAMIKQQQSDIANLVGGVVSQKIVEQLQTVLKYNSGKDIS